MYFDQAIKHFGHPASKRCILFVVVAPLPKTTLAQHSLVPRNCQTDFPFSLGGSNPTLKCSLDVSSLIFFVVLIDNCIEFV
jgi:hypothetical protein